MGGVMPQDASWVQQDEERLFFFPGNDSAKKKVKDSLFTKAPPANAHTQLYLLYKRVLPPSQG